MSTTQIGRIAPNFKLAATGDKELSLKDMRGNNVVIYFYPKDNTPGCMQEGCDFKAHYLKFRRRNTIVLGISRDSVSSHERFREKFAFPFDLLSDPDEQACRAYDVIREKNMYGRKVMGIERSTFLIDEKGKLRNEWRKIKVKGHVEAVLDALKDL